MNILDYFSLSSILAVYELGGIALIMQAIDNAILDGVIVQEDLRIDANSIVRAVEELLN
jgi:hypothetical protein